jgi:hypothetical protein
VERQQIKWVAAGLAAVTLGIVTNGTLLYAASVGGGQARLLVNLLRTPLVCLWLLGLPVSLAFAVLRHRLWEIDVIIRRTLIYSVLTAVLAGTYLGSVVLLQTAFRWLTGQTQSQLVTVLSTLAVAALFGLCGPACNRALTAASFGASTMRRGCWPPLPPAHATRLTSSG